MESAIELEQEYEMSKEEDIAFFEPEIDVRDVELEMPSDWMHCLSNNIDVCVIVVDIC